MILSLMIDYIRSIQHLKYLLIRKASQKYYKMNPIFMSILEIVTKILIRGRQITTKAITWTIITSRSSLTTITNNIKVRVIFCPLRAALVTFMMMSNNTMTKILSISGKEVSLSFKLTDHNKIWCIADLKDQQT